MKAETNAQEVLDAGLVPQLPADRMRQTILGRMKTMREEKGYDRVESLQALYPHTVYERDTLEVLTASLLSGNHVLLLGPPGSGKTTLAKEIWDLFPKEVFAVADCPVHDDPFSLIDPVYAEIVPPCPYCKANHGGLALDELGSFDPARIKAKDIPVQQVRLREGFGHARVQGSPEVFPDNLTGSINLARLEEIGDPTSPLVLEPGKVLQAHRGILFVDEVGKLPRGTQNVLLQALQEGIATPAKSRETFPASLIAITTSNVRDLANITEPLNDRLANVHTPYPETSAANRKIVDIGLRRESGLLHVAGPFRDATVELVLEWRKRMEQTGDLSEVGSNRTLIDIPKRARSYALMSAADRIDPEDFRRGALDAMEGRIRARSEDGFDENRRLVKAFLEKYWRDAAKRGAEDYWCRFFVNELKEDKAEGVRVVQALRQALGTNGHDPQKVQSLLRSEGGDARVRRFGKWVQEIEGLDREQVAMALGGVFHALDSLGAFDEA